MPTVVLLLCSNGLMTCAALTFPKKKLAWNYLSAFGFLAGAAFFAFAFKAPAAP